MQTDKTAVTDPRTVAGQIQFGDEPYTIQYRCGCIEKVRMDTTPQPRERNTYVDYDCSNCWY